MVADLLRYFLFGDGFEMVHRDFLIDMGELISDDAIQFESRRHGGAGYLQKQELARGSTITSIDLWPIRNRQAGGRFEHGV